MKAKYCLQMYNRIIISNFPRNLIIISQFLSFFSLFFQFFKFWSFLGHLLTPQTPGVPKLFYYGAGFIPGVPEMSASFKKLLLDNFFPCQQCKNPDMVIFTILGHFGGLQGGGLSCGGYLEGCTWSQTLVYQPTQVFPFGHPQKSNFFIVAHIEM